MISRYQDINPLSSLFLIDFMTFFYYSLTMTRKPLSTKIENELQKEIKKLAIDQERPLNDLLEEAIRDILKKYEKQPKE